MVARALTGALASLGGIRTLLAAILAFGSWASTLWMRTFILFINRWHFSSIPKSSFRCGRSWNSYRQKALKMTTQRSTRGIALVTLLPGCAP
jgi:hypothetical protein